MTRPRVLIWAHLDDGTAGGIQTAIAGLAQGFRDAGDLGFDLTWFTKEGSDGWLVPHLPDGSRRVHARRLSFAARGSGFAARRIGRAGEALGVGSRFVPARATRGSSTRPLTVDADLVHFAVQQSFFTTRPYVYQPHDLQHEQFPEYFSRSEIAGRRMQYGANIRGARLIVVGSEHTAHDVRSHYPECSDRVTVVPLAPVTMPVKGVGSEELSAKLPREFAFYPAAAWPHKNHSALFRALRILKDRGRPRPLVLTGANVGRVDLAALAASSGVEDLVTHLGFVSAAELAYLYEHATVTVIPTLFEAGSFPMFEAFLNGCAVVASDVCSLPAQAAGAAVLCDPTDPADIAEKLDRVWTDDHLRRSLLRQGRDRARQFSWESTARGYAAAYRRALGLPPSGEDREWEQSHARF